jgi:uncharacterized protein
MDQTGMETLGKSECLRLLAQHSVGRVAVTIDAIPAVLPVNYCMLDSFVLFRTGTGSKLNAAVNHAVVAFEVDDVDRIYHQGWSVLVVGVAEEVRDPVLLRRAEKLPLEPWAPGQRDHLVCLRPEMVSGRRISQGVSGGMSGGMAAAGA